MYYHWAAATTWASESWCRTCRWVVCRWPIVGTTGVGWITACIVVVVMASSKGSMVCAYLSGCVRWSGWSHMLRHGGKGVL